MGLGRERARQRHGRLFDQVAETLFRHDPTGTAFEYNPNEYEPKEGIILPHLDNASSQYDTLDARQRVRREVLRRQYGDTKTGYEELAAEVWPTRQPYRYTLSPAGG